MHDGQYVTNNKCSCWRKITKSTHHRWIGKLHMYVCRLVVSANYSIIIIYYVNKFVPLAYFFLLQSTNKQTSIILQTWQLTYHRESLVPARTTSGSCWWRCRRAPCRAPGSVSNWCSWPAPPILCISYQTGCPRLRCHRPPPAPLSHALNWPG